MKCIYSDLVGLRSVSGSPLGSFVRAVILSNTTPAKLNLTGADVDGLGDDDIIVTGSVIITPDKNYIAFTDGVFTEKV